MGIVDVDILLIAAAVLGFALLAGRLDGTPVTMPMIFAGAGLLLGEHVLGVVDVGLDSEGVSVLAEIALVAVLFTDASRMHLGSVLREHFIALRLLTVGMPLAMIIGAVVALLLFPDLPLATVGLLAVALAPTDAALGQSFVTNHAVPKRIRQSLNVESGLNDGLALPFLLVMVDVARSEAGGIGSYVWLFVSMVGFGTLAGAVAGWLGGKLLSWSARNDWTTDTTLRLGTLAVAAIAYGAAESIGGNGFVAAFVAGLTIGTTARTLLKTTSVFAETEGQLLTLLTFLFFGAVVAGEILPELTWQIAAYAALSLLVVRPLATVVALIGSRLSWISVAFIGWAGPRGLASIVYAVIIVDAGRITGAEEVFNVAAWTIAFSILLHGLSAAPLSRRYGSYVDTKLPAEAPECQEVTELPVRLPPRRRGNVNEQA